MLLTIVLWWVPAVALLSVIGAFVWDEWHDRKTDWEDNFGLGVFILTIGWVLGGLLLGVLCLFSTAIASGDQRIVYEAEYQVSDTSKLEYKEHYYVKFISEDEKGNLAPQQIDFDDIVFENLGGTTVKVEKYQNYHTWIAPGPFSTDTKVTIK